MKFKLKLGLILFALGFLGVLSLLTATLPLPDEFAQLPPVVLNILILLNPTLMLIASVVVGIILYDKANLTVPAISSLLKNENAKPVFVHQIKYGIPLGLLAGILIVLVAWAFNLIIPHEFEILSNELEVTLLVRFGYGGITEELLLRFGIMTFLVWIMSKITKKLNSPIYWIAIAVSTILFALGHFPAVFASFESVPNLSPSFTLLTYILIGNSVGGLVYGWLYWKKGLEAAIIAHIFTHVAMVLGGLLLN